MFLLVALTIVMCLGIVCLVCLIYLAANHERRIEAIEHPYLFWKGDRGRERMRELARRQEEEGLAQRCLGHPEPKIRSGAQPEL